MPYAPIFLVGAAKTILRKKSHPEKGGFVKVPKGTSLEPVDANLLAGLASFLMNCDSSGMNFRGSKPFAVSPIRVNLQSFLKLFTKKWGSNSVLAVDFVPFQAPVSPIAALGDPQSVWCVGLLHPLQGLGRCAAKMDVTLQ